MQHGRKHSTVINSVSERHRTERARLPILTSRLLSAAPGLAHGISSRVAGLGLADGNVGYSPPRDLDDAWVMRQRWAGAAGIDPERLVVGRQIHGNAVLEARTMHAGRGARPGTEPIGYADALMTNQPGAPLLTLHADCLPILLYDPKRRVVASIHAGWRGTVLDVAGETVRAMGDRFGVTPSDLIAFMGPAICGGCYDVGSDVADAWSARPEAAAFQAIVMEGDRQCFDLAGANHHLLRASGIREECIERSELCTKCHGDEWFSHRAQGPATGRFGAMIALQ